jgi:hypothetical protein
MYYIKCLMSRPGITHAELVLKAESPEEQNFLYTCSGDIDKTFEGKPFQLEPTTIIRNLGQTVASDSEIEFVGI